MNMKQGRASCPTFTKTGHIQVVVTVSEGTVKTIDSECETSTDSIDNIATVGAIVSTAVA